MKRANCMMASAILCFTAVPAAARCSSDFPQIGTLEVDQDRKVTVMRGGAEFVASTGTIICLSDAIAPGPASGQVNLDSGEPRTFGPGAPPQLPSRSLGVLGWLRARLASGTLWKPAYTMSESEPGFALASLRNGRARADEGYRALDIPVNAVSHAYAVSLYLPANRTPAATVPVPPQTAWITIPGPFRKPGRYVLTVDGTTTRASFTVGKVAVSPLIRISRLSEFDAVFAHACMDPDANYFDALQRLHARGAPSRYRKALLMWQTPSEEIGCATPVLAREASRR